MGKEEGEGKGKGDFKYIRNTVWISKALFFCVVILSVRRALYQPPFWSVNIYIASTVALYMAYNIKENH